MMYDERSEGEDAFTCLEQWQQSRIPVGAMFQLEDSSVHCSLCGTIELTSDLLCVAGTLGRRFGYLQVERSQVVEARSFPLHLIPVLRSFVAMHEQDLAGHRAVAFSLHSGSTLFLYDVSQDGAEPYAATPGTENQTKADVSARALSYSRSFRE